MKEINIRKESRHEIKQNAWYKCKKLSNTFFSFLKKKTCSMRNIGLLTNVKCLETWTGSFHPLILERTKQMYRKIKRHIEKKKQLPNRLAVSVCRICSMCFNISFLFRTCEIPWFPFREYHKLIGHYIKWRRGSVSPSHHDLLLSINCYSIGCDIRSTLGL